MNKMSQKYVFSLFLLATTTLLLTTDEVQAQWTDLGKINGIQAYRDERSGLEWTVTIGQVQSSGRGAPARALVEKYGFRLPSFRELQVMESHGGFKRLKITTAMQQYYETSNTDVLAAAWGNGFKTPQERKGRGNNWVIGVRSRTNLGTGFEQNSSTQNQGSQQTGNNQNNNEYMSLVPGDVITNVNDRNISNSRELQDAVRRSPRTMTFAVLREKDEAIYNLQVTLGGGNLRFGVNSSDHPNGGAKVGSLTSNSPARRCVLLGTLSSNPPGADQDDIDQNNVPVEVVLTEAEKRENRRIRILLIYGTEDQYLVKQDPVTGFSMMSRSQLNLNQLIHSSKIEENQLTILGDQYDAGDNNKRIQHPRATKQNIMQTVQNLCREVGQNGAVLVYYIGHGASVETSYNKYEHFITPLAKGAKDHGGAVFRKDILMILRSANLRFTGLITDSCSNEVPPIGPFEPDLVEKKRFKSPPITPLRAMLLYGRGYVDVNSSSPPDKEQEYESQSAFWDTSNGGYFTSAFCSSFAELNAFTQFSSNDWDRCKESTQDTVKIFVRELRERAKDSSLLSNLKEGQTINDNSKFDN